MQKGRDVRTGKEEVGGGEAKLIPPSTVSSGSQGKGEGEGLQKLHHLQVLTKWREAPSRACISAALTAGIAAAPLTHAGSGDTAAPCQRAAWRVSEKVNTSLMRTQKLRQKSHIHGQSGHQKNALAAASQQPSLASHKPIALQARMSFLCYESVHLRACLAGSPSWHPGKGGRRTSLEREAQNDTCKQHMPNGCG